MKKEFLVIGGILAGLGVVIGAFGAHALSDLLESTGYTDTFEVAVRYQFYHAFALLLFGVLTQFISNRLLIWAGRLIFTGTLIFSGSLYVLCLSGQTLWGAVTPLGGVLLIVGWGLFVVSVVRGRLK